MTDGRRSKGEGTIRWRSDGRCEGREPPEIMSPGERPRSAYGRKGDSPAKQEWDVKRKLREMRREREEGLRTLDARRLTVGQYLTRWIEGPLKASVAPKTCYD